MSMKNVLLKLRSYHPGLSEEGLTLSSPEVRSWGIFKVEPSEGEGGNNMIENMRYQLIARKKEIRSRGCFEIGSLKSMDGRCK